MGRGVGAALGVFLLCAPSVPAETSGLGGEVDARDLQHLIARLKGKVVLLNFWATWCEPCREEFPDLARLQSKLGPRGFQVIGVSTDSRKSMLSVKRFLAEQRPNFPNYHKKSGGDDQAFIDAVDSEWDGELPFSVLYDRSGKKAKTLSTRHTFAEYEEEVSALLKR